MQNSRIVAAFLLNAIVAFPQALSDERGGTKPRFEVASVRLAGPPADGQSCSSRTTPDGVHFECIWLRSCIAEAYRVRADQVSGPGWISDQMYQIFAKAPRGADPKLIPEMLQMLLAERLQLVVHQDRLEAPGYVLAVGKGGANLKPTVEDHRNTTPQVDPFDSAAQATSGRFEFAMSSGGSFHYKCTGISMAALARHLSHLLGAPVIDETQLAGIYDFELDASRQEMQGGDALVISGPAPSFGSSSDDEQSVSIFSSIKKLGLQMEKRHVPGDVIVVDHLVRDPTPN